MYLYFYVVPSTEETSFLTTFYFQYSFIQYTVDNRIRILGFNGLKYWRNWWHLFAFSNEDNFHVNAKKYVLKIFASIVCKNLRRQNKNILTFFKTIQGAQTNNALSISYQIGIFNSALKIYQLIKGSYFCIFFSFFTYNVTSNECIAGNG